MSNTSSAPNHWQHTFHCFHKIEEQILECLAWSHDSPIWASIQQAGSVPSCEDVSIPNQLETGHSTQNLLASPIIHPRVQRICGEEGAARRGEKRASFSIFHSNSMIQRNLVFIKKKGKQSFKSLFSVDDEPPTMTMCTAVFSTYM